MSGRARVRARELGVAIGTLPTGERNAITDVPGVRVGHATLIEGDDVRTGVTVIQPHEGSPWYEPVFAGAHRLNGNGELTGLEWIRESGMLCSPIGLTNTHSVGVVHDALISAEIASREDEREFWSLPVVGETWDGLLNDINGMHVRAEHVAAALDSATNGAVPEGNVGGGTGMICHGFKGGIGTASRVVEGAGGAVVGVLVQANHGRRERLRVNGIPVGEAIPVTEIPDPYGRVPPGSGSIIAIVATDAALLPVQCERLAQRAGLGIARVGGVGEHSSGDIFLAFATGNRGLPAADYGAEAPLTIPVQMLANNYITGLFDAVVEATEEAIVNALCAAETLTGANRATAYELPLDRLQELAAAP
ncbi:MAG TPA: P1 family peptidase [Gaiellaceae bacterium]|jgi:D-aminopeptidase|nr:P1 family peptidase [Gaiellaceae bacterium]